MSTKTLLSRIGSGLSLPMSLLLLIFFFLPWVEVQCQGVTLGEASGWQLTQGEISQAERFQEPETSRKEDEQAESPDARPWFILGLLAPIGLLLVGFVGLRGQWTPGNASAGLIVLGLLGVVVVILAVNVDYASEMTKDIEQSARAQKRSGPQDPGAELGEEMAKEMTKQMGGYIKTKGTGILWASLTLYILVGGCGVANLILPSLVPTSVASAVSPPPRPSPPWQPPPGQP